MLAEWPADRVERRALSSLTPYARNARKHSEAQLAQIAQSMREFGWTIPVLIDEAGTIIAGHARVLAAALLNLTEAPVIIARGWTRAQTQAYVLADNQLALHAEWDRAVLTAELQELDGGEIDLALTGFTEAELINLLAQDGTAPDQSNEWRGMPEFEQEDKTAFHSIVIHFRDEAAVSAFAQLIEQPIGDRKYLWFPAIEIERVADKQYASES